MMTGGLSFHSSVACFKCSACGKHLASEKCMLVGKNLYCLVDYQKHFSVHCFRCKQKLVSDFMQVQDKRFHKECYTCLECKKPFGKSEADVRQSFQFSLFDALLTTLA
eukprot:m.96555 g.96555  ORF g.96555 m.96555 type:complete len:108 (+) comp51327_c0_seq18:1284-1607(+)